MQHSGVQIRDKCWGACLLSKRSKRGKVSRAEEGGKWRELFWCPSTCILIQPHVPSPTSSVPRFTIRVRTRLTVAAGVRVKAGVKDSVGVQSRQNFSSGAFGARGVSGALGAHGHLRPAPLATICRRRPPCGGGGGPLRRTCGVAPPPPVLQGGWGAMLHGMMRHATSQQ